MVKKEDEYKKKLENLGVKDVNKAVEDLFNEAGYLGRVIIHYWFWRTNRHLKEIKNENK